MSSLEDMEQRRDASRKKRKNNADALVQSSRLGYVIIILCVVVMVVGTFVTQQFDKRPAPQPPKVPADAVKATALSSTWTCPISGSATDSLLLSNPDSVNNEQVIVTAYDAAGTEKGSATITLEAGTTQKFLLGTVAADGATSLVVQSYSGAVVVVRNIALADGSELVACINDPVAQADFPNLETVRNSNSVVVITNPYAQTSVIDLSVSLVDTSASTPRALIDENRGIIVPAHGRVTVDLQSLFGRYAIVSAHLQSRSGFFAAEVLLSFTGADSVQGQTIVPRTHETTNTQVAYWPGVSPSRIVSDNSSAHTHAIQINALDSDNRSVNGDAQSITSGSSTILQNVGVDLSTRLLTLAVTKSSYPPEQIYTSWLYASGNAVSAGSSTLLPTTRSFVPVETTDTLYAYNPNSAASTVEVTIYGTSNRFSVTLAAHQYKAISLADLGLDVSTIVDVTSSQPIVTASGDAAFTHFSQGIDLRS